MVRLVLKSRILLFTPIYHSHFILVDAACFKWLSFCYFLVTDMKSHLKRYVNRCKISVNSSINLSKLGFTPHLSVAQQAIFMRNPLHIIAKKKGQVGMAYNAAASPGCLHPANHWEAWLSLAEVYVTYGCCIGSTHQCDEQYNHYMLNQNFATSPGHGLSHYYSQIQDYNTILAFCQRIVLQYKLQRTAWNVILFFGYIPSFFWASHMIPELWKSRDG